MAAGTYTVTCTFAASCSLRGIKLLEITGAKTASALDGTPAGQFQLNVGTGTDAITSGNLTTANQPAMVVGACMNYGNNRDPAAGTGFTSTRTDWSTDVGGCRLEYKRVTATGTQAATYTGPAIDSWITLAAAFDEAATATGVVPDSPGPPIKPAARPLSDTQAQGFPTALKSPWVFVEPPRIAPVRRQEAQSVSPLPASQQSPWVYAQQTQTPPMRRNPGEAANPLPAPPIVGALPFAAQGDTIRRVAAPTRAQIADALPPVTAPWVDSQPIRQAPRKPQPPQSADPLPTATRLGPIIEIQPPRRFVRSIVNLIREAIGLPALLPPPPAELKLKPPLWAVFDEVSLTAEVDAVSLSATVDEVSLSVESDT